MKIKKNQLKILPPVALEPRPLINSDSKSNTILSGLTGHLGTFSYIVITFVRWYGRRDRNYGNQLAKVCTHSDVPVHNIIPFRILKQFCFITTHKHHRSGHDISMAVISN